MPRKSRPDFIAVTALVLLWALFFWRLLTPVTADQASLKEGDFSGQFVTFAAYQYSRMVAWEVPLWNPYNNAGMPFIADTQAAVFYPPRLLTIALSHLAGGWSYHALQLEMTGHVLLYTLAMYALVRRMTGSVWGGVAAAVVGGYGGYMSGYPPLQLALLEAGVWLPLAILGIFEGTRTGQVRYLPLSLTGLALGTSWLAGHPQTSWFLTYLCMAYFAYRVWSENIPRPLQTFFLGTVFFGVLTVGATAVTLFPGLEYLPQTARAGFGFDAKGNGFPFQDVLQLLFPGTVSLFSPLHVGVTGLGLALIGVAASQLRERWFWLGVLLIGLLWSFGARTAVYDALYNLLPGLRYFRGQERAAYLVAHSFAILVGFGTAALVNHRPKVARSTGTGLLVVCGAAFGAITLFWFGFPDFYSEEIGVVAFSALAALGFYSVIRWMLAQPKQFAPPIALIGLLVFELFSVHMNADSNYDPVPASEQISLSAPPLVSPLHASSDPIVRVDGFRSLTDNFGSLYGVHDARGISPLFLDGLYQLQQPPFSTPATFEINPVFWELTAVQYVYSGFEDLPVQSQIITDGADRFGPVFLHRLENPRSFAHLVYRADVLDSDEFARALLADPAYQPRESVILQQEPTLSLPEEAPGTDSAELTAFTPEAFTVEIETAENAILTLAHPHYPGWQAVLDDDPVEILWAYSGLTAIEIPAGEHTLHLAYRPTSFIIGAVASTLTWTIFAILGVIAIRPGK